MRVSGWWINSPYRFEIECQLGTNRTKRGHSALSRTLSEVICFLDKHYSIVESLMKGVGSSMTSREVMRVYFQAQTVENFRAVIDVRVLFCDLSGKAIVQMENVMNDMRSLR